MFSFEEKLNEYKEKIRQFIEKNSHLKEYLEIAQEKTKIEKEFIFVGGILLIVMIVLFIVGFGFVIDLIGVVFPLISSIKAIESKTLDDDKQWLTYWVIFSFFKMIESFADIFVASIPFYFIIKCLFLLWCWHPQSQGAELIHKSFIKVYLVPLLGFEEKVFVSTNNKLPSQLEINIENVKLVDTSKKSEIFVEICVVPPSTRRPTGVESTIFKTEVRQGPEVEFNQPIILTPLPSIDGTLSIQIKEKNTFGDDCVLASKVGLEIKKFCSNNSSVVQELYLDGAEVTIIGKYTPEE